MNERIIEMAKQCGYWSGHTIEMNDVGISKFAELIVQDCIDIIAPYSVRMIKPGEEYLHPIQEIREHFGVED